MQESIKKLYYSISEVTELTGLKQYVLRYWESEFDALQPTKNRAGNRIYTQEEIDTILKIKKLLYEEKYTIEGAKRKLADFKDGQNEVNLDALKLLTEIKKDLNDLQED